jgi:LysM repeat protein
MRNGSLFGALAGFVAAGVTVVAEAGSATPVVLYEFRDGDTLSTIAARFKIPAKEIAALNHLRNPNLLRGAGLLLPEANTTKSLPRYVPWPVAPKLESCKTTPWSPLRTVDYFKPACATGPGGQRACIVQDQLTITTADGRTTRVEVPHSLYPEDEIADIDLDGDGRPETLVSSFEGASNGLGHVYRTLVVLRDGKEVLRYDSGEFTASTAAVSRKGRCHLASSHWEEVKHPLRGPALYLVERSFDPITLRMDEELVGTRAGEGTRLEIPFDPLAVRPRSRAIEGTVVKARPGLASITLRTPKGLTRLSFSASDRDNKRIRLGDARTGRVYPMSLDVPLVHRTITVRRYLESDAEQVLWLTPRGDAER